MDMDFKRTLSSLQATVAQASTSLVESATKVVGKGADALVQASKTAADLASQAAEALHPFGFIEKLIAKETANSTSFVAKHFRKDNNILHCTFKTGEVLLFKKLDGEAGKYQVVLTLDRNDSTDQESHVSEIKCNTTEIQSIFEQISIGVALREDLEKSIKRFSSLVVLGEEPRVKLESKAQQEKAFFYKDIDGNELKPEVKQMRDLPLQRFERDSVTNGLTATSQKLFATIKAIFVQHNDLFQNISLEEKEFISNQLPSLEKMEYSTIGVSSEQIYAQNTAGQITSIPNPRKMMDNNSNVIAMLNQEVRCKAI
jgi:hypothetical protein